MVIKDWGMTFKKKWGLWCQLLYVHVKKKIKNGRYFIYGYDDKFDI